MGSSVFRLGRWVGLELGAEEDLVRIAHRCGTPLKEQV
jgi:hypothetical protein